VPTDAGYGASRKAAGAGYVPNSTQPNATAASGAAVRNQNPGAGTFNKNWYGAHPDAWHANGWAAGDEWHTDSWAAVAPAAGMSAAAQPVQYNYASAAPAQAAPTNAGGQAPPGQPDYQQSSALAQNAPAANPQAAGWTPLGVFALVRDPAATPHYIMQLAVNKSGGLGGNYTDLVTDTIKPVQGAVDKQTQRVAWTVGGNQNTVGEAGLYNLTQDEAPAVIHIGPDKTQQWLLVRLKQSGG
jgi:hypothetical protein